MSDFFTHLAEQSRMEETNPSPLQLTMPTAPTIPVGTPTTQPLEEPTPVFTTFTLGDSTEQNQDQEREVEVEQGDEVNSREGGGNGKGNDDVEEETVQKPIEEVSAGKDRDVVHVEEEKFDVDKETLDERAARRNYRTQRRMETEEPRSLREEPAALLTAKKEAAERKRKGKQVATPRKNRKLKQASLGVVIQESVTDLTKEPYYQEEESEDEGRL